MNQFKFRATPLGHFGECRWADCDDSLDDSYRTSQWRPVSHIVESPHGPIRLAELAGWRPVADRH